MNIKKIKKETGDVSLRNLLPIVLLKPKPGKEKTVLKALQQRKTIREISDKKLTLQELSNFFGQHVVLTVKKARLGFPAVPQHQQATRRKLMFMWLCRNVLIYMMHFNTSLFRLLPKTSALWQLVRVRRVLAIKPPFASFMLPILINL